MKQNIRDKTQQVQPSLDEEMGDECHEEACDFVNDSTASGSYLVIEKHLGATLAKINRI